MTPIDTPERVVAARKLLGMTQEELATALRLTGNQPKDTVRSWEKRLADGTPKRPISGPSQLAIELMLERRGLSLDGAPVSTFDRILHAIADPAQLAGERWQEETLPQWQARAVQAALRQIG